MDSVNNTQNPQKKAKFAKQRKRAAIQTQLEWHFSNLDLIFFFFSHRKHRIVVLGYVNTVLVLFSHLMSYYLLVVNSFGRKNNVEPCILCVKILF